MNLAFDHSRDLLVISYAGKDTVYVFKPESRDDRATPLQTEPSAPRPEMTPILPVDFWCSENDFAQTIIAPRSSQFVSPHRSAFIPVKQDFIDNSLYYGIRMQDVVRAFGLAQAVPGKPFYVSDESEEKTCASQSEWTDRYHLRRCSPNEAAKARP